MNDQTCATGRCLVIFGYGQMRRSATPSSSEGPQATAGVLHPTATHFLLNCSGRQALSRSGPDVRPCQGRAVPVQLAHIVDRLYSVARDARMRNSKQETLYALDVIYIHLSVSKNYWGRKARPSLLPIDDTYFVIILPWYRAAIRCQMSSHQHSSPQPAIVPGNDWLWNAAGAGSNAATLCI